MESLSLTEVARKLGISELAVRQLRERSPQSLPTPFARRPLRWRAEVVERWLQERGAKA